MLALTLASLGAGVVSVLVLLIGAVTENETAVRTGMIGVVVSFVGVILFGALFVLGWLA